MFKYVVFAALVAIALAAPEPKAKAGILAAAPVVAAPALAYSSPIVSAAYASPYAYSAYSPYAAYPAYSAYSAYSAPIVSYY
ncbi:PREDICTED: pupal cuticle protein C1B-like isoform X3 [Nicrophorus vespilloides]|nr:PREDICTED: pupal cuticle protein C1B-like isoform X3 [Nicrophorus vespilloides]